MEMKDSNVTLLDSEIEGRADKVQMVLSHVFLKKYRQLFK